jgi:uncharacterized protein (TIGR03083 family)
VSAEAGVGAGAAYADLRQRVNELVAGLADRSGDVVPACPDWRVRDVIGHLAGVVDDVLGGRLDGAGSEPWTAAQVAARRDVEVDEVLASWNAQAPQLEAVLDSFGPAGHQLLMDAATHEQDLRGALGVPGARDSEAVRLGLGWLVDAFQGAGVRVGVVATDTDRSWPVEDAVATATGSSFDLLRSFSGRRTEDEVRTRLAWEGDVDAVLPSLTFGPFRPPATPLGE